MTCSVSLRSVVLHIHQCPFIYIPGTEAAARDFDGFKMAYLGKTPVAIDCERYWSSLSFSTRCRSILRSVLFQRHRFASRVSCIWILVNILVFFTLMYVFRLYISRAYCFFFPVNAWTWVFHIWSFLCSMSCSKIECWGCDNIQFVLFRDDYLFDFF